MTRCIFFCAGVWLFFNCFQTITRLLLIRCHGQWLFRDFLVQHMALCLLPGNLYLFAVSDNGSGRYLVTSHIIAYDKSYRYEIYSIVVTAPISMLCLQGSMSAWSHPSVYWLLCPAYVCRKLAKHVHRDQVCRHHGRACIMDLVWILLKTTLDPIWHASSSFFYFTVTAVHYLSQSSFAHLPFQSTVPSFSFLCQPNYGWSCSVWHSTRIPVGTSWRSWFYQHNFTRRCIAKETTG